jgi:hypothetical protein
VVDLFAGLGLVALAIALYALMLSRGLRRGHRCSDAAGAHDDGVHVDEAAWTEIVKHLEAEHLEAEHLEKGHSPDEPGEGSPASGSR